MKIFAIDSSEKCTGAAVIDTEKPFSEAVVYTRNFPTDKKASKGDKLVHIIDSLEAFMGDARLYAPDGDFVVLENSLPTVERGRQMRGHIDGGILYIAAKRKLPVHFLYGMSAWKLALGPGKVPKASDTKKAAIQQAMTEFFSLPELPQEDISDAICIGMYAWLCGLCKSAKKCEIRKLGTKAVLCCENACKPGAKVCTKKR